MVVFWLNIVRHSVTAHKKVKKKYIYKSEKRQNVWKTEATKMPSHRIETNASCTKSTLQLFLTTICQPKFSQSFWILESSPPIAPPPSSSYYPQNKKHLHTQTLVWAVLHTQLAYARTHTHVSSSQKHTHKKNTQSITHKVAYCHKKTYIGIFHSTKHITLPHTWTSPFSKFLEFRLLQRTVRAQEGNGF